MNNKKTNSKGEGSQPNSFRRGIYAAAFTSMACVGYSLVTNDYSKALPALLIAMPSLGIGYMCGALDASDADATDPSGIKNNPEHTPK